ncbi:hypothetical protein EXIGLDRAFT_219767 [Exidia glandulosa HHB12029]|uniref:Uncharacterized protein n=1 Tax=Exidia glandulosa HHB12029 TaxID=1314781 RepID=A0A165ZXT0_EXIGL|nr:hypothetical protein EXIGLDRAFT_219767 [Exidia glandulosa HHB12029]
MHSRKFPCHHAFLTSERMFTFIDLLRHALKGKLNEHTILEATVGRAPVRRHRNASRTVLFSWTCFANFASSGARTELAPYVSSTTSSTPSRTTTTSGGHEEWHASWSRATSRLVECIAFQSQAMLHRDRAVDEDPRCRTRLAQSRSPRITSWTRYPAPAFQPGFVFLLPPAARCEHYSKLGVCPSTWIRLCARRRRFTSRLRPCTRAVPRYDPRVRQLDLVCQANSYAALVARIPVAHRRGIETP